MYWVSEQDIRREREKARELRRSRWWQNKIANAHCYYCQNPTPKKDATMDHIVPVSQGGKSTEGNVVVACKACNTAKRDSNPLDVLYSER